MKLKRSSVLGHTVVVLAAIVFFQFVVQAVAADLSSAAATAACRRVSIPPVKYPPSSTRYCVPDCIPYSPFRNMGPYSWEEFLAGNGIPSGEKPQCLDVLGRWQAYPDYSKPGQFSFFFDSKSDLGIILESGAVKIAMGVVQETLPILNTYDRVSSVTSSTPSASFTLVRSGDQLDVVPHDVKLTLGYLGGSDFSASSNAIDLYPGEIATLATTGGNLKKLRFGSLNGSAGLPGDPLSVEISADTPVIRLDGPVSRLAGASLLDVAKGGLFVELGGTPGEIAYDPKTGILVYSSDGRTFRFLALGEAEIFSSSFGYYEPTKRTSTIMPSGAFRVAYQGITFILAGAPENYTAMRTVFAKEIGLDNLRLRQNGTLEFHIKGDTYVAALASGLLPAQGESRPAGVEWDNQGYPVYRDSAGWRQTLYPAFWDFEVLYWTVKSVDGQAEVFDNGDGSASLIIGRSKFTLFPEFSMCMVTREHSYDSWWLEGPRLFYHINVGLCQAARVQ